MILVLTVHLIIIKSSLLAVIFLIGTSPSGTTFINTSGTDRTGFAHIQTFVQIRLAGLTSLIRSRKDSRRICLSGGFRRRLAIDHEGLVIRIAGVPTYNGPGTCYAPGLAPGSSLEKKLKT